jgi:ADP-heptose:LPS heptosyltransferase
MPKSIGIIAWGAMADVLYATPIIKHIRELHPDAFISWHIRDKFAPVIAGNPHIDEIVYWKLPEGHTTRQEAEHDMDRKILDVVKRHDKYYDLQYWPRYSNFYERPTEDFISLRARNAGLNPNDVKDRSIVLNITDEQERVALKFILDNDLGPEKSDDSCKTFITVNHISYAASPVWSPENYQLLVDLLEQKDIKCVFTGAPNEPLPNNVIDARGMPYKEWASLIDNSDLWFGLDSGAKTLAAATETPMIVLHSKDFPMQKTGCQAMGIRTKNILELCPAPNVTTVADLIVKEVYS